MYCSEIDYNQKLYLEDEFCMAIIYELEYSSSDSSIEDIIAKTNLPLKNSFRQNLVQEIKANPYNLVRLYLAYKTYALNDRLENLAHAVKTWGKNIHKISANCNSVNDNSENESNCDEDFNDDDYGYNHQEHDIWEEARDAQEREEQEHYDSAVNDLYELLESMSDYD